MQMNKTNTFFCIYQHYQGLLDTLLSTCQGINSLVSIGVLRFEVIPSWMYPSKRKRERVEVLVRQPEVVDPNDLVTILEGGEGV